LVTFSEAGLKNTSGAAGLPDGDISKSFLVSYAPSASPGQRQSLCCSLRTPRWDSHRARVPFCLFTLVPLHLSPSCSSTSPPRPTQCKPGEGIEPTRRGGFYCHLACIGSESSFCKQIPIFSWLLAILIGSSILSIRLHCSGTRSYRFRRGFYFTLLIDSQFQLELLTIVQTTLLAIRLLSS
jgi:hypothetical protein